MHFCYWRTLSFQGFDICMQLKRNWFLTAHTTEFAEEIQNNTIKWNIVLSLNKIKSTHDNIIILVKCKCFINLHVLFFPLTLTIAFQYNFARLHIDAENAIDRKGGGVVEIIDVLKYAKIVLYKYTRLF